MSEGQVLAVSDTWFRGARIGPCFFCGAKSASTYDIKAMNPSMRCCKYCVRTRGLAALKAGADEATAAISALSNTKCLHCGEPVLVPDRGFPAMWCNQCEAERRAIAQGN